MEPTETAANKLVVQTGTGNALRSVRILIADGDLPFCKNLRQLLTKQRRIEIVGEAHDVGGVITLTETQRPHVVLLDQELCRNSWVQGAFQHQDASAGPLKVITIDAPEKTRIIDSFRLGAKGIILKGSAPRIWWKGIAAVLAGQYWLGNESLAALIQAIRESSPNRYTNESSGHFGLTPRELEIVQKIADGRSNKEVGKDCSIRERTVKHHLTNIFGKLGVTSRLELALFAREHDLRAAAKVIHPALPPVRLEGHFRSDMKP